MALPAPVDHRHGKPAIAQVGYGLEIFFDLLAASGENADSTLAARRRRPAREAQFGSVGCFDGTCDYVLRNGIRRNRDERHGRDRIGEKCWKSRARAPKQAPFPPS